MKIFITAVLFACALALSGCASTQPTSTPDIQSLHPSKSDANTAKLQKALTF